MTIQIYDDFLHEVEFEKIENLFLSNTYPWFWCRVLDYGGIDDAECKEKYNWQCSSTIFSNMRPVCNSFDKLTQIIGDPRLKIASVCRIKSNLNPITDKPITHGMHIDTPFKCTTSIFYVNSNNGYTLFEDGTKVDCVKNRIVTFPSSLYHSGVSTTDTGMKVVINFNYFTYGNNI